MKIVLFCGKKISSDIVFTHLKQNHNLIGVVTELPFSRKKLVKNRIKKLGFFIVFLQLLFVKSLLPLIKLKSKRRFEEIKKSFIIEKLKYFDNKLQVSSINNLEVLEYVNKINPDVIVVNGTRIINKKILNGIDVPVINLHVGITPKYRGVHGGYWALVNKDIENCGVTVHYVDTGIDTGSVICQRKIETTKKDSFVTYPLLQLKNGLKCLDIALNKIKDNDYSVMDSSINESKLYYHPTIIQYLYYWVFKGVK